MTGYRSTWVVSLVGGCLVAPLLYAHDTTHVHPMITEAIGKLIKAEDGANGAYAELYEVAENDDETLINWGTDADAREKTKPQEIPAVMRNNWSPYVTPTNVINGVVQEDAPATKVKSHFKHALNGTGLRSVLSDGNPSDQIAMDFFRKAIDLYGRYSDETRSSAFFHLGMALHHVEDMSSPAHVHNDQHISISEVDRDDYEGYYLPYQRLPGTFPGVTGISFADAVAVTPVQDPLVDIWGVGAPASLIGLIHSRTTYQARLEFPLGNKIASLPTGYNTSGTPAVATGELAEMFPCPGGDADNYCLHWNEDAIGVMAHWSINGVGEYHHQAAFGLTNEWWPVSEEIAETTGASPGSGVPDGVDAPYYIEQLAVGNNDSSPVSGMVTPEYLRTNFTLPWNPVTNPTVSNSRPLLEWYKDNLLAPVVSYGAGFVQFWYDIANTPPYLKQVKVTQGSAGTVYQAVWEDVPDKTSVSLSHTDVSSCYAISFDLICQNTIDLTLDDISSRKLNVSTTTPYYLSELSDITLELTFNEPISKIRRLTLGKHDAQKVCQETQTVCLDVLSLAVTPSVTKQKTVWTYTIQAAAVAGLNGKLLLTVEAEDKNKHRDGIGGTDGALLDGTPASPARRMVVASAGGVPEHYLWQQTTTPCGPEDDPTAKQGCFAYDFTNGDQNHYLLFDTALPSGDITIDSALP